MPSPWKEAVLCRRIAVLVAFVVAATSQLCPLGSLRLNAQRPDSNANIQQGQSLSDLVTLVSDIPYANNNNAESDARPSTPQAPC